MRPWERIYTNRNGLVFSPQLILLAMLSPPHYGKLIVERNRAALAALDGLLSEAGRYDRRTEQELDLGCPHCSYDELEDEHLCATCLWTRALFGSDKWQPCVYAQFPSGYSYKDVFRTVGNIRLEYATDTVTVIVPGRDDDGEARVRAFLLDHIDWGNLPVWGEMYKTD